MIHASDELYASHVKAWSRLWQQGRIDLVGDLDLARLTYSSWYYLLSSMPLKEDPAEKFVGLSPCGLPLGDLNKVDPPLNVRFSYSFYQSHFVMHISVMPGPPGPCAG